MSEMHEKVKDKIRELCVKGFRSTLLYNEQQNRFECVGIDKGFFGYGPDPTSAFHSMMAALYGHATGHIIEGIGSDDPFGDVKPPVEGL